MMADAGLFYGGIGRFRADLHAFGVGEHTLEGVGSKQPVAVELEKTQKKTGNGKVR